jgi:Tol biopolymer transport system component
MSSTPFRAALAIAASMLALAALAVPSQATMPGENGRIILTSGRNGTDATAELFLLPVPSSVGGGTISPPIATGNGQHRHATWSPDRTKIAYARGDSATGNFDIYVQDLTAPGSSPVNITNSNNVLDDRPNWSPDGTRIAWESEVTDGSNQMDVLIRNADGTGGVTNFTNSPAPDFEGKPVWSPSSAILYYQNGNPNSAANADIVRKPVSGGTETLAIADSGISEFQPSISPDGTKMCFTLANGGFNNTTDVMVAPITTPPSGGVRVSFDLAVGEYNCTWSPDGQFIAYAEGIFGAGRLVMVRQDGTSLGPIELAQDANSNRFDGNPEWAPDGRPQCADETIETERDKPITFTIECTDTGPAYERTNVSESPNTQPTNGTLEQDLAGDPFTYTPNQGFTGTDSFEVQSFDDFGFGDRDGVITINVKAPGGGGNGGNAKCGGKTATIEGTPGKDKLKGTSGNDVIAAGDGNDKVKGGKGNDLICGGKGKDKLNGGPGKDKLKGGPDKDKCSGGGGKDKAGCEIKKSIP